jgi:hypothetical protein
LGFRLVHDRPAHTMASTEDSARRHEQTP